MSPIPKEWSCRFAWMSVFCSFLIVLNHSLMATDISGWRETFNYCFINRGLTQIAVPYFFFAAGYFLVSRCEEYGWYREAVVKRLKSLVVPFLVWNLIGLLFFCFSDGILQILHLSIHSGNIGVTSFGNPLALIGLLGFNVFEDPILPPLWFVRSLFVFVLVTPLLLYIVRRRWLLWISIIALLVASVCVYAVCSDVTRLGYSMMRLFPPLDVLFFLIGIVVRLRGCIDGFCCKWRVPFLMIGIVALLVRVVCHWRGCAVGVAVSEVAMIMTLTFGVFFVMPTRALPKVIQSISFPVYLMHWMVLMLMAGVRGAFHLRYLVMHSVGLTILFAGVVIVISIGLTKLIYRFMPKFATFAFGGR